MKHFREITQPASRIFAIGDIHGCSRELKVLLEFLRAERNLSAGDLVVFIGDFVDRGPDTRGVIQLLVEFQQAFPETIFLRGNHEDMLLDFLGYEGSQGNVYILNGGANTLQSYDISPADTSETVVEKLPPLHLGFLLGLESFVQVDGYIFVHAGLNPLKSLSDQEGRDLFWIRDEFIANVHQFNATVVFGHTPYQNVLFNFPYKIGIDTGLVYENMLTCLNLTEKEILQVKFGTKRVTKRRFPANKGSI